MSTLIQTEVFTLAELVERGDERAVDRALMWMAEAWDDIACELVSEDLADALQAANLSGLTVSGWDYWRGSIDIQGEVTKEQLASIPPGHFLGRVRLDGPEWIERVSFGTRRAMDYGGEVWIDLAEGAPFGWDDDRYADLIAAAMDWKRKIEHRLSRFMREAYEGETSRDALLECAEVNGYTFTSEGERFG